MKRYFLLFAFLALTLGCLAQKRVVFTPRWTPQAQFAGYYVAKEKGFFKDEGLDVVIKHIKPNSKLNSVEMLNRGMTNIIGASVFEGLAARENDIELVNFLQTSQKGALMCVANFPIKDPKALNGKKIGSWKRVSKHVADMFFADKNIKVEWIPFMQGINLFLAKAIDATLCYSFNEYIRLLFAKGEIPPENVLRFSDKGYDFPEDALFATKDYYMENRDIIEAFRRASIAGWDYCRTHKEEALKIVKKYTDAEHVQTNNYFQSIMLDEILRLQEKSNSGTAAFTPITEPTYKRIVGIMRKLGCLHKNVEYNDFIR